MNVDLLNKIYNFFDNNGIKGRIPSNPLVISLDSSIPYKVDYKKHFIPDLKEFGIDSDTSKAIVIDYVFETFGLKLKSVDDLLNLKVLNGVPFALYDEFTSEIVIQFAHREIKCSVTFREDDLLNTLGLIKKIRGSLGFSGSSVEDLGELEYIGGNLWVAQENKTSKLKKLGKLLYVGGNVNLKNSLVNDLGKLSYVGGNLNLRGLKIEGLESLKYVGGNVLLSASLRNSIDFQHIEIKGKVKYFK